MTNINYKSLLEDFPEYIDDIKSKEPVLFGLFCQGKHMVISGSKNTWRSKSAASSGLRNIVYNYLYNKKIVTWNNHLKEVNEFKKMLLDSKIIEIKEIS
jgi:hypothetical protein